MTRPDSKPTSRQYALDRGGTSARSLSQFARLAVLYAGAVFLMATYLLPAYPKSISGWLWMIGGSLPYAVVIGFAGNALHQSWGQGNWKSIAVIFPAIVAVVLATAAYLWLCGIV